MRRILGGLVAAAVLFIVAPAATALAEGPVDVEGAYLTDDRGILTGAQRSDVEQASDALFASTGTSLYVVLVDTFDQPSNAADWVAQSAQMSGLGKNDLLLAIAVGDRNYAYSRDSDFALSDDDVDRIIGDDLVPQLRENDWAGGIVAFTQGVDAAMQPGPPWGVIIPVGAMAVGAAAIGGGFLRQRLKARASARAAEAEVDALTLRADAALVAIDDSVKTGAEEVEFAAAQFGEEATVPFREALSRAEALLAEAFEARRGLSDTQSAPARMAILNQVIRQCNQIDTLLDEQDAAFDALRDLEQQAPALREQLRQQAAQAREQLDGAERTEQDLRERFGDVAVADLDDSGSHARELLSLGEAELDRADAALAEGHTGIAAVSVRSAQQALGQVGTLVEGVQAHAENVPAAVERLRIAVADVEADIAEADMLAFDDAGHAAAVAAAAATAAAAVATAATLAPDPALVEVTSADTALAAAIRSATGAAVGLDRAHAQLDRVRTAAQQSVERAQSYIGTRRGAIGQSARGELAAARRDLAAMSAAANVGDLAEALALAEASTKSADGALQRARREVQRAAEARAREADRSGGGGLLAGIFGDWSGSGSSSSSGSSRSGWSSSSRSSSSGSSRSSRSGSSSSRSSRGSSSSSRSSRGGRF